MADDRILNAINALKQHFRKQDSDSSIQKREQAADMFRSSNPESSDSEMVEYATNPENQLPDIDPTGAMGSTRAVRELGPTLGKMANKVASTRKSFNDIMGENIKNNIDTVKFNKREFQEIDPFNENLLKNIKQEVNLRSPKNDGYESLVNSRNVNPTGYNREEIRGLYTENDPYNKYEQFTPEYLKVNRDINAEQKVIKEAGYNKLRQLLNNIRKATGE